jgi:hypothetical protein
MALILTTAANLAVAADRTGGMLRRFVDYQVERHRGAGEHLEVLV